jgi:hypothetical protein
MQSDIFSPILEKFSPTPTANTDEMNKMIVSILHEIVMAGKNGGETVDDPMSTLAGMPGGNVWQK